MKINATFSAQECLNINLCKNKQIQSSIRSAIIFHQPESFSTTIKNHGDLKCFILQALEIYVRHFNESIKIQFICNGRIIGPVVQKQGCTTGYDFQQAK